MRPVIISDTSCLILLDKIQELDLLRKLYGQIITTLIVAEEFGGQLPEWIIIRNPKDVKNQKGRKIAKQLGLAITGTLGLMIEAKSSGYVAFGSAIARQNQTDKFPIK